MFSHCHGSSDYKLPLLPGTGGATVEAVSLMKRTVGSDMKVKASGGIHTLEDARKMFYAGADRIGSSSGVAIAEAEMSEIHTI